VIVRWSGAELLDIFQTKIGISVENVKEFSEYAKNITAKSRDPKNSDQKSKLGEGQLFDLNGLFVV